MASRIVESVLKEAERMGAKKVLEVHVEVGDLTFINLDQLKFSYKILAQGNILEGSKLTIERCGAEVKCKRCGYRGPIKSVEEPSLHITFPSLKCPECGEAVEVLTGRDCTIKRIRMKA